MASYNPGESLSQKTGPSASSACGESRTASSPEPKKSNKPSGATEPPKEPEQIYHAFERPSPDLLAIGNPSLELALKLKGHLGYFVNRDKVNTKPVFINLCTTAMRDSVQRVLQVVIERLLRLKGLIKVADSTETETARQLAITLSNGVMIMTYMRLRRINSLEATQLNKFCMRPKVPDTLQVPAPYALAISQLGIVEASSLEEETRYQPTIADNVKNFCLPSNVSWSTASATYLQAMEYGKSIGMTFASVDLSVPFGSSWWLYRQVQTEGGLFSLQCALPEDNYTEVGAVLHTLFCHNVTLGPFKEIFDLSPIAVHDYGSMIRNPHADISVSSYFAIGYFAIEEAPDVKSAH